MTGGEWDGKPRRKNDIYLHTIEKKVDRIFDFLRGEFGDEGLNGEKIEGRTKEEIRLVKEQVIKQNSRIAKLEDWRKFLNGCSWIVGALVTFAGVIVLWIKK